MKPVKPFLRVAGLVLACGVSAQATVTFDWAIVGDAGNPADATGFGAVNYEYKIATKEVNLSQYTEFLNAVDPNGLNPHKVYEEFDLNTAGIAFNAEAPGGSKYSVIGSGLHPVAWVSAYSAMRFTNWLHNGQGTGSTETGAYSISTGDITGVIRTDNVATVITNGTVTLSVGDQVTVQLLTQSVFNGNFVVTGVTGNAFTFITPDSGSASGGEGGFTGASATHAEDAAFWLPTEDEWYKAAYYDPTKGGSGGYWMYPTNSDSAPGNMIGVGANQANYLHDGVYSVTQSATYSASQNYLTDGGVYNNSAGYYGTHDQAGNLWEWNETLVSDSSRGLRGGAWSYDDHDMISTYRYSDDPSVPTPFYGFRVAALVPAPVVPEPSALQMILMLGGVAWLLRRRGSH